MQSSRRPALCQPATSAIQICLTLYFPSFLSHSLFCAPLSTYCQQVLIPNLVFIFPSSLFFVFFFHPFTLSFLHTPVVTPFLSHLMLPPHPLHLSHRSCAICCRFYWFFYYLSAHGLLNSISIATLSGLCWLFFLLSACNFLVIFLSSF